MNLGLSYWSLIEACIYFDKDLTASRQVEIYDMITDQWEIKQPLIHEPWDCVYKLFLFND